MKNPAITAKFLPGAAFSAYVLINPFAHQAFLIISLLHMNTGLIE